MSYSRYILLLYLLLPAVLSGCAVKESSLAPPSAQHTPEEEMTADIEALLGEEGKEIVVEECSKTTNGVRRGECYRSGDALQAITSNEPPQGKTTKIVKATKAASKSAKGAKTQQKTRKVVVRGRCQPQCLIYARCRSGFMSCRLGNTNPLRWWPCAKSAGITSQIPQPGSVLLLDKQDDQRMRVGHAVYVEEVCKLKDGRYMLRVSHSNYDRRCSLDLDAKVLYDVKNRSVNFISGAWAKWAKRLRAFGFVTG